MKKRTHQIKIRLSDSEYLQVKDKISKSGLTQQAYLICALEQIKSTTPEELEELKKTNEHLKIISQNIRSIGNNINQLAKHTNIVGVTSSSDIKDVKLLVQSLHKEVATLWQYSRAVILRLKASPH